jgi:hypothetical protein
VGAIHLGEGGANRYLSACAMTQFSSGRITDLPVSRARRFMMLSKGVDCRTLQVELNVLLVKEVRVRRDALAG